MKAGDGLLAIWNDIEETAVSAFIQWHSFEHMPERVAIPGFRRGRRFFASAATPRWLTLYEADDPAVFTTPAYLKRLNNPTEGTRSILQHFQATERTIGQVVACDGRGSGGVLAVWRLWEPGDDDAKLGCLVAEVAADPRVCSAYACREVGAATRLETEEKRMRRGDRTAADMIIVAELYGSAPSAWSAPQALQNFVAEARTSLLNIYTREFELTA